MLFNQKAGVLEKLNVESSYMLWRDFVDRNITIEHANVLKSFINDPDFKAYIEKIVLEYEKEVKKLNSLLNKFSIVSPDPSPRDQNVQVKPEVMSDQGIAAVLNRFMRLDVNLLMLSQKETPTNEEIYDFGRQLAKAAIHRIDDYIVFMKSKRWIYVPPKYRHSPPGVTEDAAVNDIFLLHDHLIFRYNNIRLTQIFSVYVTDQVFNTMLTAGVKILQGQIKAIEDRLLYYGIPIPKPYSSNTVEPQDKDMFEDRFIFNQILRGIQDAVALHGSAIPEIITNDDLRKFFYKVNL